MAGQRKPRQPRPALPPRGLRPRYSPAEVLRMQLAHVGNLDGIATGRADEGVIWDVIGNALTWSYVADKLGTFQSEMHLQVLLATRLVERWGRTGRVGFSGPDYQLAKEGVVVMDALAELTDIDTAREGARWAKAEQARMVALADAERALQAANASHPTESTEIHHQDAQA